MSLNVCVCDLCCLYMLVSRRYFLFVQKLIRAYVTMHVLLHAESKYKVFFASYLVLFYISTFAVNTSLNPLFIQSTITVDMFCIKKVFLVFFTWTYKAKFSNLGLKHRS